MKLLIIIPALNSSEALDELIPKVRRFGHDILVIDDGSTDGTANAGLIHRVQLIRHPANRGKGAALKSGFKYAIENGYDAVITIDSDGQHDPKYIPSFIDAYENIGADLIIGSRLHNKAGMPQDRRLSNFLSSKFLSLILGVYVEDSQCGYRLITTRLLKNIDLKSDRFELESEIIIKAIKKGFKIRYQPIRVNYSKDFKSSMNRLTDTLRWVKMVLEEI